MKKNIRMRSQNFAASGKAGDAGKRKKQNSKSFFADDPLNMALLQNPTALAGNSMKAGLLDMIKSQVKSKKDERSAILNELVN